MSEPESRHWYSWYRWIQQELQRDRSGAPENVRLGELAKSTGYKDAVIGRMLKAGQFIDRTLGPLEADEVRCGYAHIELLERIGRFDPSTGRALSYEVLAGQRTLKHLKQVADAAARDQGALVSNKLSQGRTRSLRHLERCEKALRRVGPGFFGCDDGRLFKVITNELFGPCFALYDGAVQRAVIFVRAGDTSQQPGKTAAELLRLARLAYDFFDEVWFLLPEDRPLVQALGLQALETHYLRSWLHLCTVSEDGNLNRSPNLGPALDYQLDGITPRSWRGENMQTGEKIRYELFEMRPLTDR